MNPARWQQIKQAFGDALQREPSSQRAGFLAEALRSDPRFAEKLRRIGL
jgi:hypothetical protein